MKILFLFDAQCTTRHLIPGVRSWSDREIAELKHSVHRAKFSPFTFSHVSPLQAGAGTRNTTARGLSAGRVEYQPNRFVWFVRRDIMHNRQRVFRNFGAAIRTPVITINFRTNYGKSVPLGSSA